MVEQVTYTVLEANQFFQDQADEVEKAELRAWIQTMALEPSYFSNLLISRMIAAAQRGIDARVAHDAYSDYVTDNTFNHLTFFLDKKNKERKIDILKRRAEFMRLMNEKLRVKKTNVPKGLIAYTPLAGIMGRDHKKISIIDDIFYLGGVNLTPLDSQRVDVMLKGNNPAILTELVRIFNRSFYDEIAYDALVKCDEKNTLLVDGGKRGKSIIMDYVYDLIQQESDRILVVSPYLPSGTFRRLLNNSVKKDVHVAVVTTGSLQTGLAQRISQRVHDFGQIRPLFEVVRHPGIVHAKILLFGNHTAVIGSHNFDELFIQLGTEEISLSTTQPEIVTQLQEFTEKMRQVEC